MADDVDHLLEQLKSLPLVDGANLDRPFAAYQAFEVVLGAVLRAALAPEGRDAREGKNGSLFRDFVRRDFRIGRGWSDDHYARLLWDLRSLFVKEMRTGLRRTDVLRQHAADELALRTVHVTDSASITHSPAVVEFRGTN